MTPLLVLVLIAFALAADSSPAQSQQPYAGFEARSIKALFRSMTVSGFHRSLERPSSASVTLRTMVSRANSVMIW